MSKRPPRPYVRIDNSLASHPKSLELDPESYLPALGLHVLGVCHSDRLRTDGFLSTKALRGVAILADPKRSAELADELVSVGLWEKVDGGWRIHDYLDWQCSAAQIAAFSEAQTKKANARWNPDDANGNADGDANGNADGDAPRPDQPTPDMPSQNEPDEPVSASPHGRIHEEALGNLTQIEAANLVDDYGYAVASEAVSRAITAKSKGEIKRSFGSFVVGVSKNLKEQRFGSVLPDEC